MIDAPMLDYAIDYARDHGWPVFPCDPATKRPLTKNGFKDATTDPEQISAWWHRYPKAMIGLPTGKITGIVVLDVDVDPSKPIDGRKALVGLEMPQTMMVQTPRGGFHYYFQWPDGVEIRNSASDLGLGLDVRGEGGYVIAAPSINKAGKAYLLSNGSEILPSPAWFVEKIRVRKRPASQPFAPRPINDPDHQKWGDVALSEICAEIASSSEGERHKVLVRLSTKMLGKVMGGYSSISVVRNRLWQAASFAGLDDKEISKVLDWGEDNAEPHGPAERRNGDWKAKPYRIDGDPGHQGEQSEPSEPKKIEPFTTVRASIWHELPIPQQHFLDHRKLIPMANTTILTGASGIGKTYLALQAAIASAAGSMWLGAPIRQGPVIFYSAEENMDVLHSRVARICLAEGIHLDRLDDLHFVDLTEIVNASLIKGDNRTGSTVVTELYNKLDLTMDAIKPVSVWLDNRGLIVTGNENDRNIAAGAMRACQLLGAKHDCAIAMLSHPSNAGADSGTGASGSTAWFAGGRSVLNLTRPEDASDRSIRTLDNNKTNYSEDGTLLNLRWEMDRFTCTDPLPRAGDDIGIRDKAERVFMKLLIWHNEHGIEVSPSAKSGGVFAPKMFAAHPQCERITPGRFRAAMLGLIDTKKIEIKSRGRKDSPIKYLVVCAEKNPIEIIT